jgi:hypothetical protein
MNVHKMGVRFLLAVMMAVGWLRAELVVMDELIPPMNLSPHLALRIDPTGELGIEQVLAGGESGFKPNKSSTPSFGFTRAAVWLRFEIRSATDQVVEVVAEAGTARLSHFTWYVVADGDVEQIFESGAAAASGRGGRFPRVKISLPPGETRTVYARVSSDTSLWLPLRAGSPGEMDRQALLRSGRDSLRLGITITLSGICFFLAGMHRQKLYLILAGLGVSYVSYQFIFNGYPRVIWLNSPLWIERELFGVVSAFGAYFFMRFNRSFLQIDQASLFVRSLQFVAEALLLVSAVLFLFLDFYDSVRALNVLLIVAILLSCVGVGWRVLQLRRVVELWFWITWIFYALPLLLLCLNLGGIFPVIIPIAWIQSVLIPVILMGLFLAMVTRQKSLQELELGLSDALQAEADAKFSALRYQINPHFLYNTLTSIDALSRSAPHLVPSLVSKLSTFLRLRLEPSADRLASLGQELDAVRSFLDIERVRFGDALVATYDIDPQSLDCRVPEFILQPLVENAVKYGFENDEDAKIHLESKMHHDQLVITVTNHGLLSESAGGLGVGTENIRQRLALHYGEDAKFQINQVRDQVVVRLQIPVKSSEP